MYQPGALPPSRASFGVASRDAFRVNSIIRRLCVPHVLMERLVNLSRFLEDRARCKACCARQTDHIVRAEGCPGSHRSSLFDALCLHFFSCIARDAQIYLMGLVNNPDTSQALKLWRGLDPSWEQVLR